jgi:hypothetical protein
MLAAPLQQMVLPACAQPDNATFNYRLGIVFERTGQSQERSIRRVHGTVAISAR